MIPIQEILHRIQWDNDFGQAEFIIAYHDRFEDDLIKAPLKELCFDREDPFDFELIDDMGVSRTIPLHRIREVYKNSRLI